MLRSGQKFFDMFFKEMFGTHQNKTLQELVEKLQVLKQIELMGSWVSSSRGRVWFARGSDDLQLLDLDHRGEKLRADRSSSGRGHS